MHWQGLRLWKYQRVVKRDTKLLKINYSVVRVWSRFKLNGTRKQAIYKKIKPHESKLSDKKKSTNYMTMEGPSTAVLLYT